jgi:RNA polymerase sigma-70 factor (ECF subfamily)
VVELNRAIAIAQRSGPEAGLVALRKIAGRERLRRYPFYPAALGELQLRLGRARAAREEFVLARGLARSPGERRFFDRRIAACERSA